MRDDMFFLLNMINDHAKDMSVANAARVSSIEDRLNAAGDDMIYVVSVPHRTDSVIAVRHTQSEAADVVRTYNLDRDGTFAEVHAHSPHAVGESVWVSL